MDITTNKRIAPRFNMHLPVTYRVMSGSQFTKTVTRDISKSGAKFIANSFIAPFTDLAVEINLFSKVLTPTAKVVWSHRLPYSDSYQLGVKFQEFNLADSRYLQDYLSLHE